MKNPTTVISKLRSWLHGVKPFKILALGFLTYVCIGLLLISLPIAQKVPVSCVDNLFNVVSAMSTTGLATGSVSSMYTFFGELVLLGLIQLGAIGYMTLTSFFILSRNDSLSPTRIKILSAEFTLPDTFKIKQFVKHVVIFTLIVELVGTLLLWLEFSALKLDDSLWSAIFHSVSAFSTAGFSLYSNGLESFKDNISINLIIGALCYTGAIGFIVPLDIYRRLTGESKEITFTSKVILSITTLVSILGTFAYIVLEKTDLIVGFFQIMSASTTAGFNTVPIGELSSAVLVVIMIAMIIGASPSGTGGGIKTTTVSALLGIVSSVMRGHPERITFLKRAIPFNRVFTAVAATVTYLSLLTFSVFLLCIVENHSFLELCFETASALGTVGLSMGITSTLTDIGKVILTATMFLGRLGPLTLGIAFFQTNNNRVISPKSDLAT